MSTTTVSVTPDRARSSANAATFAGNLKSEWIKLTTVRSTIWSLAILAIFILGLAALFGSSVKKPSGAAVPFDALRSYVVHEALSSLTMASLIVAVLGVLFSAGEYGTGSIRPTMTATPRRLPVLWAKMVVLGLTTFVFGFLLSIGAVAIAAGQRAANGWDYVSVDPLVLSAACGAAGYLAFTAIFAVAIGFIFRNVAAAITTVAGIFFVIPIVMAIFVDSVAWLRDAATYQFSKSGNFMYSLSTSHEKLHPGDLYPWQGALVVLAWVAAATIIAATIVKTRDT